jgi:triosephosphate isomerase (TIM)
MTQRKPIISGNWKLYKTPSETRTFVRELAKALAGAAPQCEVIVAPPFPSIPAAVEEAKGTLILVSGQNLYWEDSGAFTGEVSAPMLQDAGCSHAIVGHSERRQYFGETDKTVNLKIKAAQRSDLIPIFCLGETLDEREAGKTFTVVKSQLKGGLDSLGDTDPQKLIVAYEPVWAIGTGRTATPEQAQEVHAFLRTELAALWGADFADRVRILYGGSVKPSNTRDLMSCQDIDGALVGGASLKAEDFIGIISAAM